MRRERLILIGSCITLLLAFGGELRAWTEPPTLRMFDIGQGDGILVSSRGAQVLVDGGPDGELLSRLGAAMPFFDRTIDLLVLSHPHTDHLQSFPELLRRYRVSAVLLTGADYANPRYGEFLELLADEEARVVVADPDVDLTVGDLHVDVLWPPPRSFGVPMKDVNDDSVVARVTAPSGTTVLFTGDMEKGEERAILEAGVDVRADVLKVAHHGSRTSSSTGFLLAVDPRLAIASVAADNSYGLPDEDVLARYAALGIPLRMTKDEGTIEIPLHSAHGAHRGDPGTDRGPARRAVP